MGIAILVFVVAVASFIMGILYASPIRDEAESMYLQFVKLEEHEKVQVLSLLSKVKL